MKLFHALGKAPYYTNSYIIAADNGSAAVVDPAAPIDHYIRLQKENGFTINRIILTHGHFDHVYSLEELKIKTDAEVYCASEDVKGDRLFPVSECDHYLKDGDVINFGDVKLLCIKTPGHSKGSFCFSGDGFILSGDTLFAGSIGRTDLEGGDFSEIIASIHKLMNGYIGRDAQILPGHGEFSTLEQERKYNPYINTRGNEWN